MKIWNTVNIYFYPSIFLYFIRTTKNKSYCLWLKNNIVCIFVLYLVIIVKAFDFSVHDVCIKTCLKNNLVGMMRNGHHNITILKIIVSPIPNIWDIRIFCGQFLHTYAWHLQTFLELYNQSNIKLEPRGKHK